MQAQPQANLRGLKALVGFMGVLIILGTAMVVGTVIHRLYAKKPVASMQAPALVAPMAATVAVPLPAGAPLMLAPGEHIVGIAGAGGDVAVWVSGPQGERVLLLNLASGGLRVAVQSAQGSAAK
jgi:hypothetical protein